jgi:hypothetical protein
MQRIRVPLIAAFVLIVLLLAAFGGATAASFPLWFRYRSAAGLSIVRTVAQIAAGLAAVGLFASLAIVAVAAALQPASRRRKLLYVLPLYGLGLALVGVLLYLFGIGTVGIFTTAWIGLGALLGLVGVIVAAARMPLGERAARQAITATRLAGALGLLAGLCMIGAFAIVLTSTPSAAPAGQNGAQQAPGELAQGGGQEGPGEPGGPSGPGGRSVSTAPLLVGAALTALFAGLALASSARGARALCETPAADGPALRPNLRYEAGRALFSCIAISIVGLALAQLVPVRRDNPPAQTAVQWDSPATQQLARRACMDCHSNETTWPWYAYVAPGSWLMRSHVGEGREQFNLSELNNILAFRASRLPEEAAQQIRNGAMPPKDYLILHPEARLTQAEKQQLMQGLQQSLANSLGLVKK